MKSTFYRIAIIVGHSELKPGAQLYNGQYEYEFNSIVAALIQKNFTYDTLRVFWKDMPGFEDEVLSFHPDLIVELHLNAFKLKAYGCEALYLESSLESKYEANLLLNEFESYYKIKKRGAWGLTRSSERGHANLELFQYYPIFIFEPCFANYKTSDSEKIVEDPEKYAQFLTDYFCFKLGIINKTRQNIMNKMISIVKSWFN